MQTSSLRIGNQTCAYAPENLPLEFALRHGFTAFEWFSDRRAGGWCETATDAATRRQLRQLALDHDIAFSVHAPFDANPITPEGSAAILQSIDFAADVGAKIVNFHLCHETPAADFAAAVQGVLGAARKADVLLTLENTVWTSPDQFNAFFRALEQFPASLGGVGMCLDTGHANLQSETRNNYVRFVDRLNANVPIRHWHAHENWGDADSHLPLFTGPAGRDDSGLRALIKRLSNRRFCGSVILEQWPTPPNLLATAASGLQKLFEACPGAPRLFINASPACAPYSSSADCENNQCDITF